MHTRHPHGELRDRGGELRDRYPVKAGELHDRRQLLQWEHEWNNQVSSFRAPVERAVAQLKTWRILFTDYRRPLQTFASSFRAAIGLYFFKERFA
jgi:DDE superfamily endonuclease